MHDKEGCTHSKYHRDEHKALKEAKNECKRAHDLSKNHHPERYGTTQPERVGKEVSQGCMSHQLAIAMTEKKQSEDNTHDKQQY